MTGKSPQSIAKRLRALSTEMMSIAIDMDYYGGMAEWAKHGVELAGAAHIAQEWASEMEKQISKDAEVAHDRHR